MRGPTASECKCEPAQLTEIGGRLARRPWLEEIEPRLRNAAKTPSIQAPAEQIAQMPTPANETSEPTAVETPTNDLAKVSTVGRHWALAKFPDRSAEVGQNENPPA